MPALSFTTCLGSGFFCQKSASIPSLHNHLPRPGLLKMPNTPAQTRAINEFKSITGSDSKTATKVSRLAYIIHSFRLRQAPRDPESQTPTRARPSQDQTLRLYHGGAGLEAESLCCCFVGTALVLIVADYCRSGLKPTSSTQLQQ